MVVRGLYTVDRCICERYNYCHISDDDIVVGCIIGCVLSLNGVCACLVDLVGGIDFPAIMVVGKRNTCKCETGSPYNINRCYEICYRIDPVDHEIELVISRLNVVTIKDFESNGPSDRIAILVEVNVRLADFTCYLKSLNNFTVYVSDYE